MKWELDDNARSGFHYLILGVLIIGLPTLLIAGIDAWQTREVTHGVRALHIFRNGYLFTSPLEMTATVSTRGERIAMGVLAAMLCGGLITCVAWLIGLRKAHWRAGRWTGLVILVYSVIAAVVIPGNKCTVTEQGLLLERYSCMPLAGIPIPFTHRSTLVPTGPGTVLVTRQPSAKAPCRVGFLPDADRAELEIVSTWSQGEALEQGLDVLSGLVSGTER